MKKPIIAVLVLLGIGIFFDVIAAILLLRGGLLFIAAFHRAEHLPNELCLYASEKLAKLGL